jgi:hypothetical protein
MANWQLTMVILASVLIGTLIPLLIMITIAFYRAGREIAEIGARLTRTLTKVETISDRVEVLSGGLKGGETNIADLLAAVGNLARGLEQNMKIINIISTIMSSVGPAIASYIKARYPVEESGTHSKPHSTIIPGNGKPLTPVPDTQKPSRSKHIK